MAILKYDIKSEKRTKKIEIHNWRLLKKSMCYFGSSKGGWESIAATHLVLDEQTIVACLTRPQILALDGAPRGHVEHDVYFGTSGGIAPGYCYACQGGGKIDWVQKAMKSDRLDLLTNTHRFDRDLDYFLLYDVRKGQLTNQIIFARTLLKRGEEYCPECSGTGIVLDGRLTIYEGMPGVRKRLVLIRSEHYEGID